MRVRRSIAAVAIVTMLGGALPGSASAHPSADVKGSTRAVPAEAPGITPHRYKKPIAGSWKVLAWVGVGYVVASVVVLSTMKR